MVCPSPAFFLTIAQASDCLISTSISGHTHIMAITNKQYGTIDTVSGAMHSTDEALLELERLKLAKACTKMLSTDCEIENWRGEAFYVVNKTASSSLLSNKMTARLRSLEYANYLLERFRKAEICR